MTVIHDEELRHRAAKVFVIPRNLEISDVQLHIVDRRRAALGTNPLGRPE
jgi:hypothetical protein